MEYDGNDSRLHSYSFYLFSFLNLIIIGIIGIIILKKTYKPKGNDGMLVDYCIIHIIFSIPEIA